MEMKNDGGAAFPYDRGLLPGQPQTGMSLRDWFATHADVPWNAAIETLSLRGCSHPTVKQLAEYRAQLKYIEADAMLAARTKES